MPDRACPVPDTGSGLTENKQVFKLIQGYFRTGSKKEDAMRFLLFPGCKVPYYVPQYETATRLVLSQFDVQINDMEFNCCGYPIRFLDFKSFLFSSARNIALAGRRGLPLLCLCMDCYGTLRYADFLMTQHEDLRKEINGLLQEEGLQYPEQVSIKHLLNVLYEDILPENITKKITRPVQSLKVAVHYGCHILRPQDVVRFDSSVNPNKFETLIELTGANCLDWPLRLQCCGDSIKIGNDALSFELGEKKMKSAKETGADLLCVSCTHCQMQFERVETGLLEHGRSETALPSLLYPQLLGLSLGFDPGALGISKPFLERLHL
jgi:heterodisulfide reductase subunit B